MSNYSRHVTVSLNNIVPVHVMMYVFNQFNAKTEVVMFNRLVQFMSASQNGYYEVVEQLLKEQAYS